MNCKKQTMIAMISVALLAVTLSSCGGQASTDEPADTTDTLVEGMVAAAELVSDIPTIQAFTDEAVSEDDIDKILSAGINAPSATNSQNWHFTAITDANVLQEIADNMGGGQPMPEPSADESVDEQESEDAEQSSAPPTGNSIGQAKAGITDAPLAIVVSCTEGSEFDAGLACQNMSVEAQLLGYGTKIISSPTIALNGENQEYFRELLSIPDGQSAVAVLLVGTEDTSLDVDAVTSATTRYSSEEIVTRVEP